MLINYVTCLFLLVLYLKRLYANIYFYTGLLILVGIILVDFVLGRKIFNSRWEVFMQHIDFLIGHFGYLGIIVVLIGGIVGLPIPDEVLLTYVGQYCFSR